MQHPSAFIGPLPVHNTGRDHINFRNLKFLYSGAFPSILSEISYLQESCRTAVMLLLSLCLHQEDNL